MEGYLKIMEQAIGYLSKINIDEETPQVVINKFKELNFDDS